MDLEPTNATQGKILLVDDNDTYRMVIKSAIELAGYKVIEAGNGVKGLEMVKLEKPVVILVDIYMPEMDGLTMLANLKKDPELAKIPVVMLTNVQEELDNAVKAGAEEAILKSSVTPTQIIDMCKKYLTPQTVTSTESATV